MYLFSRRARLAPGNTRAAQAWATSITEKVNQIVSLNTSLFAQTYSPEVGTLVWSTFVPDLATLESANDKLLVDDSYVAMVDAGAKFVQGSIDDSLLQLITADPDPNRQVEYATTIQTVSASGTVTKGIELGVEIAQRAEKVIGTPVMFVTAATGPYGAVAWITGYADVNAFEAANQALAADTKFGDFVDKSVRGVYAEDPLASETLLYRRIV